jgi:hypothetical protein
MFYKPNYCCNCGEKIERIEWNPLTSRRFCDVCETENPLDKLLKIIFPTVLLVFGIFGISGYFQSEENVVGITKSDQKTVSPRVEDKKIIEARRLKNSVVEETQDEKKADNSLEDEAKKDTQTAPIEESISTVDKPKQLVNSKNQQKSSEGAVYFCGAETKKGTPCSRKVKGGGRCWQHTGREAMLAAKDLKVEN